MASQADKLSLYRDKWFWAALVAALPVWVILPYWQPPSDPVWLFQQPGRFLLVIAILPILEELSFRGLLQGELLRRAWGQRQLSAGIRHANLVTSLVFCGAHLLAHNVTWAAAVFIPSLLFGWFRDRHNSLVSPIVLHCWYNLGYFLLFG